MFINRQHNNKMKEQPNKNATSSVQKNKIQDGFSSQQEAQEEIIYSMPEIIENFVHASNDQIKIKLQAEAAREMTNKKYSLEPDMINGWQPKIRLAKPIPLTFCNYQFDQIIQQIEKYKKQLPCQQQQAKQLMLCYLGPRYQTTYYAWYDKQFQFPYGHLNPPKSSTITNRSFVGQHWNAEKPEILQFDSLFESGNLDCVLKVGSNQYDLFLRVDSNTRGHLQWYNFKIKNMQVGKVYKLNICNFQKGKNLYARGMKPYLYSQKKFQNENIGWHQIQSQTKYRKKMSKTQKIFQYQISDNFFQLSFQIMANYQNDELKLAYCIPYTYSYLKKYLNSLTNLNQERNIISLSKLCTSLGGHPVDELTITQNVQQQEKYFKNRQRLNKKVIFITGRCHPGQSNGSWMVQGLIDFLCGHSDIANFMRKNVIFKIIPMLNPDGVILGNYRTGAFGKDFNRQFNCPDKDIHPEIYNLKEMFWSYKQIYKENAFIYLDFHGHSVKKNVFAYGPEYPIIHKNYYQSRMIAKLMAFKTKMFRYHSCIFKISQSKQSTGRAIFLKSHKIPFTFTIQASNGCYFDNQQGQDYSFNQQKWKQVGQKVIEGIYEYLKVIIQLENIRIQKLKQRKQILLRKRQRVKVVKNKNANQGYFTSMGFRKCKTLLNEDTQSVLKFQSDNTDFFLGSMEQGMNEIGQNSIINDLLRQIKKQEQKLQGPNKIVQKQSDDEISQGSSDSQGLKDDLDIDLQKQLLIAIKSKKNNSKRNKLKTENYNKNSDSPNLFQLKQEFMEDINKNNLKTNSKQMLMKKFLWKKKSTVFSSISPKKQQSNNIATAKILNFNFSLNPVECSLSKSTALQNQRGNQNKSHNTSSTFNSTYYTYKCTSNRLQTKKDQKLQKINQISQDGLNHKQKRYQYSDNFKKTFMSVQKQILRRDSYKRYLVHINNSQKKSNCLVQDVKGKKIGDSVRQDSLKNNIKKQQKAKTEVHQVQKISQIKSPTKIRNQKTKFGIKMPLKKPQSEIIIFQQEDSFAF